MTTGQIIKKLREKIGMSQEILALKMGYSHRSSINKIELGKSDIPLSKLYLFSKIFNVTPCELLGKDDIDADPISTQIEPTASDVYESIHKIFGKSAFDLLKFFNSFNSEGQEKLLDMASDMSQLDHYKKSDQYEVVSKEA